MSDWLRQNPRSALVAGLAVLLLTYGLGSFGLLEDNEARFFEISWEMARSGDWLVPHLNFISHFHKPPGTFWLVGGSLRLFGESEWAGRLPVALGGLLTIALTWLMIRKEGAEREAAWSALILVTCVEFWFLSRLVLTDMFLTVTVMCAFYCAWRCRRDPGSRLWLGFWMALGASVMFKGPIGLVIVLPVMGLHRLTWRPSAPWNVRPLLGVPIFLLLALPWYIRVCLDHPGLLEYFLNFQTKQRMLSTVHGRPGPFWFYLPVLVAGFFPWSVSLPQAVMAAYKKGDELDRLLLWWGGFPLLFFSCAGSKLPTYLLPIFPALAMLVARAARADGGLACGRRTLGGLGVFGVAVAAYLGLGLSPELRPGLPYLCALVGTVVLGLVAARAWGRLRGDPLMTAGFVFAGCLLCLASALGPCEAAYSSRPLARMAREGGSRQMVEVADHLHGLPYYLDQRIVQVAYPRETQFDPPESYEPYLFHDLDSFLSRGDAPSTYILVLRRSDYDSLSPRPAGTVQPCGPWVLLRPGASSTVDLQTAPSTARPGPVDRGSSL